MTFSQVIGQENIKEDLRFRIRENKLAQSLLFSGKTGWGTLPMALALAQYLFCEQPTELDSCGTCSNCVQVSKLQHPDLHISFPSIATQKQKANLSSFYFQEFKEFITRIPYGSVTDFLNNLGESKSGNISSAEVQHIVQTMWLMPYQGDKKVQIIWMAEELRNDGNRLLKLLEEPPKNTYLILVAEHPDKLLGTILSRLQHIRFKPLTVNAIEENLMTQFGISQEQATQLAWISEGDYTKALSLKDNWSNELLPEVSRWLNALYTNDGKVIVDWVDQQSNLKREEFKGLFQYIQQLFSTGMRLSLNPHYQPNMPDTDVAFANKIASLKLTVDSFEKINDGIAELLYDLSRNVHLKTSLMSLSLKMQYWLKNREIRRAFIV